MNKPHLIILRTAIAAICLALPGIIEAQIDANPAADGRKYDYFVLEAVSLKTMEAYDEALDLFLHALALDPDGSVALYETGQLYMALNRPDDAVAAIRRAVALEPGNYWYAEALAELYRRQNRVADAIALLADMAERFPAKSDPLFGLLDMYSRQQNYDLMITTLNRIEDKVGKSEQLSMEKFRIYVRLQDMDKAFEEIESLVREYPLDMRYLTILGDVYMQNGKPDEAYAVYRQVLKTEPHNPGANLSLASYYEKTDRTDLYNAQLDSLLMNAGVNPEIKINILRQYILQDKHGMRDSTAVIARFDDVIALDPDDTQIPMLYAQYLISKNMEAASIPVLEHILRLDPANTAARMTLLGSAIRREDFDEVIRITEPGIEVTPEVIEFYYYLGIAYYQRQDFDNALRVFDKALENMPSDAKPELISDFYSMKGDILHSKARTDEAFAAYDAALRHYPDNIGALNNYAYYISIQPKPEPALLDKAEEMSYKTVRREPANATYLDTYAWILFVKKNFGQARLYIDDALKNGGHESDVIVEHAGDIYYMYGDPDAALTYWKRAREMGNTSKTLKKKISKKRYIAP